MKIFKNSFFAVFLLSILPVILACCAKPKYQQTKLVLDTNWEFRQSDSGEWLPAIVPGCVHTNLLAHDLIPDPFFGDNEMEVQWVEKVNWEYRTAFDLNPDMATHDRIELVFEGLDTYADVFLNDSLLLRADNIFREWRLDCKPMLKASENRLLIRFTSPVEMDSLKASALPYQLPDSRSFTRKAPFQYGWDWAPRLITSGIWKPVFLKGWSSIHVHDVFIDQKEVTEKKATFSLLLEYEAEESGNMVLSVVDETTGSVIKKTETSYENGTQSMETTFEINEPKLWWSNGLGEPHLYNLRIEVSTGKTWEVISRRVGVRTIELVQEPDSIGSSFYFSLNGVPVFMKGANYVPQDQFPSRVPDQKYISLMDAVVNANLNMLRVWGGGIYEKDLFYDLCDENGILVWQDFMFACNMYPGDAVFVENVSQEAIQQVKRLRKHPSLAIWCGNNEVDEGWHNWGWQRSLGYSPQDSAEIWNNYLRVFEDLLPGIVLTHSPQIPYVPTSPKTGWGHEEALYSGSMHYWGVWWGEEPFGMYEKKVGRFMSEYGFQGFPDMKTIDSFVDDEDKHLRSPALRNHQKHPRGMELIHSYLERDYTVPTDFEHYVYVSQLVQASGVKKAIEAHRRAMPWCMGTLFWQLNDCWPAISWSAIDYLEQQKALYHFVRESYKEIIISFEENEGLIIPYIVSDRIEEVNATLEVMVMDFSGIAQWSDKTAITIAPNSSVQLKALDISAYSKNDHLLTAKLMAGESTLAAAISFFEKPKNLNLPPYEIDWEVFQEADGFEIRFSSDVLIKNLYLSSLQSCQYSDNYFDLLPGEKRSILVQTDAGLESFIKNLRFLSLYDTTERPDLSE